MKKFISIYKEDQCIADQVELGNTFLKRFKGLMGRRNLSDDQGFYLMPCQSIHTFQMHIPIDVLFLNDDGIVLDIAPEMRPWRTRFAAKGTMSTLELASKMIQRSGIAIGDKLTIKQ